MEREKLEVLIFDMYNFFCEHFMQILGDDKGEGEKGIPVLKTSYRRQLLSVFSSTNPQQQQQQQ